MTAAELYAKKAWGAKRRRSLDSPLDRCQDLLIIGIEETVIFWCRGAGAMDHTIPKIEQTTRQAKLPVPMPHRRRPKWKKKKNTRNKIKKSERESVRRRRLTGTLCMQTCNSVYPRLKNTRKSLAGK